MKTYRVYSCKEKLCDVAVDRFHGQPGLRQEVGEITALHFFSTGNLLSLSCKTLINVAFCWWNRD